MVIYKITNMINGKVYVGQTIMPLMRRWRVHQSTKRISPLTSSMKKHGVHNFKIEVILDVLVLGHINDLEAELIVAHGSLYPNGYNLMKGASLANHMMGQAPWNKGKKATPEALKNQSVAHIGLPSWNKGMKASAETKAKQSGAKVGKRISPATEFKPGAPSSFKGRKHTPEALKLIAENGNARKVICVETGEVFVSMKVVAETFGIAHSYLQRCIKKEQFIVKLGLTFKILG